MVWSISSLHQPLACHEEMAWTTRTRVSFATRTVLYCRTSNLEAWHGMPCHVYRCVLASMIRIEFEGIADRIASHQSVFDVRICCFSTHTIFFCSIHHRVTSVPHHDGTVYELDGLQPGPIPVGTYTTNTDGASADPTGSANATDDFPWLSVARSAIQTRIEKYQSSEIKFNLMELTADKRSVLQSKIKSAAGMGDESDSASVGLVASLNMELVAEEELRENWKEENERRRHNYLPFCVELLGALGRSGTLQGCTKRANEKMARVRAERRAL